LNGRCSASTSTTSPTPVIKKLSAATNALADVLVEAEGFRR
jgi:hypothetical protein